MLYLLERVGETDYDEVAAFVVRASSEEAARQLVTARRPGGDEWDVPYWGEGAAAWLDPAQSTCRVIDPEGTAEIICRDTRAG